MVPIQHRQAHASIAFIVRMYVDFRPDHDVVPGNMVFRCSIAIPTAILFTLRSMCYHIPRKTRFQCRGSRLAGWAFTAHYVKRPSGRTVRHQRSDLPLDDLEKLNNGFHRYIPILKSIGISHTKPLVHSYYACELRGCKGLGPRFYTLVKEFIDTQDHYRELYNDLLSVHQRKGV